MKLMQDAIRKLQETDDSALFTAREVKQMLAVLAGGAAAGVDKWIRLGDAARILDMKADTLRKQCARWAKSANPRIRVRKDNDAEGAHWWLNESDVFASARTRELDVMPPTNPAATEEDLVSFWAERVTRNL